MTTPRDGALETTAATGERPEYTQIERCRICGNPDLEPILHLGQMALTGVFPERTDAPITAGPLEIIKCVEDGNEDYCGLVQLRQSYRLNELYGDGYGYRSGLNRTMVQHLQGKVAGIQDRVELVAGDLVVDIGSNDGTLLGSYPSGLDLLGVDPTGERFREYYREDIRLIPDFFSLGAVNEATGGKKAKVITSIAMFYDLEIPLDFMKEVHDLLVDDGIWVFEQSYMPAMLDAVAYDTICHEHLEYYGLKQIKWMADRVGFRIADVEFSNVNGGSFSITAQKRGSRNEASAEGVDAALRAEKRQELETLRPYEKFSNSVYDHRSKLQDFVHRVKGADELLVGYGASTKGNVILQFCGFTAADIPCIGEVNESKFGRCTPGTGIPIVSEREAKAANPDYLMVLPWHFRDFFVEKEIEYTAKGGKLLFPLPTLEVVPGL